MIFSNTSIYIELVCFIRFMENNSHCW